MQRPTSGANCQSAVDAADADYGNENLEIDDDLWKMVMGKGGRTRLKIERVSGCRVTANIPSRCELHDDIPKLLKFTGTGKQRRDAMRYVRLVMQQLRPVSAYIRQGKVCVNADDIAESCTVVRVPSAHIGMVTGTGGAYMRTLEDEYGVMLSFADISGTEGIVDGENLLIFGNPPGRRGAQLSVMCAIEKQEPGYYTQAFYDCGETYDPDVDLTGHWATDTKVMLNEDDMVYMVGKGGSQRKRLAVASGCVVQYVGNIVFMTGTRSQRSYAQEYIELLFQQRDAGRHAMEFDTNDRQDCTAVQIPEEYAGYFIGGSRKFLSKLEDQWGALLFFSSKRYRSNDIHYRNVQEMVILSVDLRGRRGAELTILATVDFLDKKNGHKTESAPEKESTEEGFDTDHLLVSPSLVPRILGKDAATRIKVEQASGAFYQVISNVAWICGDRSQRQRCRDYIGWLLADKEGRLKIDASGRTDVIEVDLPNGIDRLNPEIVDLREIEVETHTFCMMAGKPYGGKPRLLIFGQEEGTSYGDVGRARAEKLVFQAFNNVVPRERFSGSIKSYCSETGYGFITGSKANETHGKDIFFNKISLDENGTDPSTIWRGVTVSFELQKTRDGKLLGKRLVVVSDDSQQWKAAWDGKSRNHYNEAPSWESSKKPDDQWSSHWTQRNQRLAVVSDDSQQWKTAWDRKSRNHYNEKPICEPWKKHDDHWSSLRTQRDRSRTPSRQWSREDGAGQGWQTNEPRALPPPPPPPIRQTQSAQSPQSQTSAAATAYWKTQRCKSPLPPWRRRI